MTKLELGNEGGHTLSFALFAAPKTVSDALGMQMIPLVNETVLASNYRSHPSS